MAPRKRQESAEEQRRRRRLQEAGITVVDVDVEVKSSDLDARILEEVGRNLSVHLYKAKDRKTLERLQPPPIEDGIFVLHTGEYCAATDVAYYTLRRAAEGKSS